MGSRLLPAALLLQAAIGPVGASDVLAWLSSGRQLSEPGSGEPLPREHAWAGDEVAELRATGHAPSHTQKTSSSRMLRC